MGKALGLTAAWEEEEASQVGEAGLGRTKYSPFDSGCWSV